MAAAASAPPVGAASVPASRMAHNQLQEWFESHDLTRTGCIKRSLLDQLVGAVLGERSAQMVPILNGWTDQGTQLVSYRKFMEVVFKDLNGGGRPEAQLQPEEDTRKKVRQALLRATSSDLDAAVEAALHCEASAGRAVSPSQAVRATPVEVDGHPPVVMASPAFEAWAVRLRKLLGSEEISPVSWESFKSGDPNIRFDYQLVAQRRVVVLFDTIDQSRLLEQLALLQALQGFAVPDAADVATKWKHYAEAGTYSWGRAAEIVVVIPWYRPCQMERTSRWIRDGDAWSNGSPQGTWLVVPTAQTLARSIAAVGPPPPGNGPAEALDGHSIKPRWIPPMRLVFVELHEETPVKEAVRGLGVVVQTERFVPYFLEKFRAKQAMSSCADEQSKSTYVLFPDYGGYRRYKEAVDTTLGLAPDHVLWIKKSRVGGAIEQVQKLFFDQGGGVDDPGEKTSFAATDHVCIIDDFTNSGSTLFGAVNLVRSKAGSAAQSMVFSIFVSHLVASYSVEEVQNMIKKLSECGPQCKLYTTDSIPLTTDVARGHEQVEVFSVVDFLATRLQ